MAAELVLPAPIGLQPTWLASEASRKVLRVGRRGGKSRFDLLAAVAGHGPGAPDKPKFPGILQGGDVVWVAQDYPNLTTVMWREEFVPRFAHLPFVSMNAAEHWVSIRGLGTLYLRSAEAIGGIRGIGKNLIGVIIDEAAHLDLERALLDVVLPALLDNDGWLILTSTTNAGPDGNIAKRVPSYFNLVCEQIRKGERGPEWVEFCGTAFDNPSIDDGGVNELIAEYAPESPALRQEVFAELLAAGVGLALPMVSETTHLVERFTVPAHWRQFGAFDWGYNHPWVFGWFALDEDGNIYVIDTVWGRGQEPDEIAETVEAVVPIDRLRGIVAGLDIWQQKGRAAGHGGVTIEERLRKRGWGLIQADTQRVLGLDNLRSYLACKNPDSSPRTPRLRLMDTGVTPTPKIAGNGNRRVLATLASMQLDEKNIEDALKVDADAAGRGGDDSYDMLRYAGMWVRLGMKSAAPEKRPSWREMVNEKEREQHYDHEADRIVERARGLSKLKKGPSIKRVPANNGRH